MKQSVEIFWKSLTVWPPEAKNGQIEAILEAIFTFYSKGRHVGYQIVAQD